MLVIELNKENFEKEVNAGVNRLLGKLVWTM